MFSVRESEVEKIIKDFINNNNKKLQ